jgi:hypothetical protein
MVPARVYRRDLIVASSPDRNEIDNVNAVIVDASGRMFILDWQEQAIHVLDSRGVYVKQIAHRGSGPGELENARTLSIRRDSLWVISSIGNRITALSLSDFGARSFQATGSTPTVGGFRMSVVGIVAGGVVGSGMKANSSMFQLNAFAPLQYVFATERGDLKRILATAMVPTNVRLQYPMYLTRRPSDPVVRARSLQPFGSGPLVAVNKIGNSVILLEPLAKSDKEHGEIALTVIRTNGDTTIRRTLTYTQIPITNEVFERVVDSIAAPRRGIPGRLPTMYPDRNVIRDSIVRPPFLPPVSLDGLLIGLDGTIWLRKNGQTGGTLSYWMLSEAGVPEASITLPAGLVLLCASRELLYARRLDSDGLPQIERLRLARD